MMETVCHALLLMSFLWVDFAAAVASPGRGFRSVLITELQQNSLRESSIRLDHPQVHLNADAALKEQTGGVNQAKAQISQELCGGDMYI
ncbi:unnamed protein product [Gadus morhua 'NCC']